MVANTKAQETHYLRAKYSSIQNVWEMLGPIDLLGPAGDVLASIAVQRCGHYRRKV